MGNKTKKIEISKEHILKDFSIGWQSRHLSITGRKEVLNGKAKFGIFGDGKEVAQLALAHFFKEGDWRSGYYRDQTLMLATGMLTLNEFFHQLYGSPEVGLNPSNGGRSFNNHFGTRLIDENGNWFNQTDRKNSSSDISPTAGQIPRSLGLALASKLYRNHPKDFADAKFSKNGNEIVFVTIGDSSTSEGHFFEILNSAGVQGLPLAVCIWDDGYGISVEKQKQTIKASISETIKGFAKEKDSNGILIYKGKGWDYPGLINLFSEGLRICREQHIPVVFHIDEITQPLGHSTSGSHERYKSEERLKWENEFDCLIQLRHWILESNIASESELDEIEKQAAAEVKNIQEKAWKESQQPLIQQRNELLSIIQNRSCVCKKEHIDKISILAQNLRQKKQLQRRDITSTARKILRYICVDCAKRDELQSQLHKWIGNNRFENFEKYSSSIYSETAFSPLNQEQIPPKYEPDAEEVPGRVILRDNFDNLFSKYPKLVIFGEDVGKIGGVNQTYEGLQEKYGEHRIFDTGIRETSIIGKGIGLALRGFRPIAEIQYLDYLLYAIQTLSDDLATLRWRTAAGQAAPLIISTRGHRLEGIWHAGSPTGMVINGLRGIHICVPRNMTQAAGMYNTLLEGDDPALVIEALNGYRLKEPYPSNIGEYKVPLGIPEIITQGNDITIVTYGSNVRIAQEAVQHLNEFTVQAELIDIQTLIPFDLSGTIIDSLKKTGRVVFFDEDVPGGATGYMMQKVLDEQGGFRYLKSQPRTLCAREHRPAYTSDGDYYSNPNSEDLFELVYQIMHESKPDIFKQIF
jgi:2-oxoisovalerate dehydrogenase E1 component